MTQHVVRNLTPDQVVAEDVAGPWITLGTASLRFDNWEQAWQVAAEIGLQVMRQRANEQGVAA